MSWEQLDAAAVLEFGNPSAKLVLLTMCQPACKICGLTWPGVAWISRKTGLGATAVRTALDWLERERWVRVHNYAKGGRGRSTEYVVLPQITELSTAPCERCLLKLKTHRQAVGIAEETHRQAVGIAENPPPGGPKTHRLATPNHSENQNQSHADRPAAPAGSPPARISEPPLSHAENLAKVQELMNTLRPTLGPPSSRTASTDPSSAETEAPQGRSARLTPTAGQD